jgi:K(+)-stimulated pyrophosphate-energized sodium pump
MFTLIISASLLGLLVAYLLARHVLNQEMGNPQMLAISDHIREGAMAFLKRQYGTIAALTAVLAVIIFLIYALTEKFPSAGTLPSLLSWERSARPLRVLSGCIFRYG